MRRTLRAVAVAVAAAVAAAVALAGCGGGKGREAEPGADRPPAAPEPAAVPPARHASAAPAPAGPPVVVARLSDLEADYDRNELAADAKYRGRRVRGVLAVERVGRDPAGRAYVAQATVAGFGGAPREPNYWCYFPASEEAAVAALRVGVDAVLVEGTCRGRTRDGVDRGLAGFDWRITFEDCRVLGPDR